ncbi:MAG: energy-coupling factor ABC transporter substrate-binding protein [Geoalkalibacter sp.]|jgi:cobalt/nickel transport protein|uniref:energy-coupling factor ABC transporter substrate-binding protein n=1 Tax=Geoalkalibacter sp. TaxID=3041440 RepID=UPI002A9D3C76|nr:energy-coupling factor ABC transporter substrate-binding protein [Thermodesulfobacteriota bacterium]
MKKRRNLLLILAVILLALLPLWVVQPVEDVEPFAGADGKAMEAVSAISPDYEPWFSPLWEPPSAEIESLLFAFQAALGGGFIGYYLGASITRVRMRRAWQQGKPCT